MLELIKLQNVPSLIGCEIESADLACEYWTPEKEGESKRVYFMGVQAMEVPDHNNPDKMVELDSAVMLEEQADGSFSTIVNGSIRLRSILERLEPPKAVQITYRGKKKNRSNGNMSDNWSVVTLVVPEPKGAGNAKSK